MIMTFGSLRVQDEGGLVSASEAHVLRLSTRTTPKREQASACALRWDPQAQWGGGDLSGEVGWIQTSFVFPEGDWDKQRGDGWMWGARGQLRRLMLC